MVLAVRKKPHHPSSRHFFIPWCFLRFQGWEEYILLCFCFVSGDELQIKTNKFILKHEPLQEAETLAVPSGCHATSVSEGTGLRESFEQKSRLKEQCGNPVKERVKKEETNFSHRARKEFEGSISLAQCLLMTPSGFLSVFSLASSGVDAWMRAGLRILFMTIIGISLCELVFKLLMLLLIWIGPRTSTIIKMMAAQCVEMIGKVCSPEPAGNQMKFLGKETA